MQETTFVSGAFIGALVGTVLSRNCQATCEDVKPLGCSETFHIEMRETPVLQSSSIPQDNTFCGFAMAGVPSGVWHHSSAAWQW